TGHAGPLATAPSPRHNRAMRIARCAWLSCATALLLGVPASRATGDDPPMPPAPTAPAPGAGPAMGDGGDAPSEPESPAAELDGQIKTAIEKGIAFLRTQQ